MQALRCPFLLACSLHLVNRRQDFLSEIVEELYMDGGRKSGVFMQLPAAMTSSIASSLLDKDDCVVEMDET